MMRRGLGRGRLIAAFGGLTTLVGCFLPWYTVGGQALPARMGNAFDGAGIVVFVVAVALLALVALPYAATDQPLALDRPLSFAIVLAVGVIGFLLRAFQLFTTGVLGLPDRALGLWLAGVGLAVAAWGVAEILSEQRSP